MFIIYKSINKELERKAYSDIAYFERCEWQTEIDRTVNILNFCKICKFSIVLSNESIFLFNVVLS